MPEHESPHKKQLELQNQVNELHNLLAVIHRDGGQHTQKVGIDRACTDAEKRVFSYLTALAEAQKTIHSEFCSEKYHNDECTSLRTLLGFAE